MAFVTKTWKDRLVEFAGRRKLKNVATGAEMIVDVSRNEGTVSQAGDAFSAANMNNLEQRIKNEFDALGNSVNQCFTSVSSGKTLVAAAITDKGVSTAATATYQVMANNIRSIPVGGGGAKLTFSGSGRVDINKNDLGRNVDKQIGCTGINGWNRLTTSNFAVGLTRVAAAVNNNGDTKSGIRINGYNYNPSNGILTVTLYPYTERYDSTNMVGLGYLYEGFVYAN